MVNKYADIHTILTVLGRTANQALLSVNRKLAISIDKFEHAFSYFHQGRTTLPIKR